MAGDNVTNVADVQDDGDSRQRSTISFPYNNLGDAVEVAQAIHSNVGTGDCDDAQLSAWMDVSTKSSGFRGQVSAARLFGLVETSSGRHKLTSLGRMVVDPLREREGRARAFMTVPLYSAVYEKYKGGVLPPAAAFERDIVGLGVIEKQKEKARQVFERSADQAGFFESGRSRLVMPGFASRDEPPKKDETDTAQGGGGGSGNGGSGNGSATVDPIISGLLARLPKSGDVWPEVERKLWLQLLEGSFKLIYKDGNAA